MGIDELERMLQRQLYLCILSCRFLFDRALKVKNKLPRLCVPRLGGVNAVIYILK